MKFNIEEKEINYVIKEYIIELEDNDYNENLIDVIKAEYELQALYEVISFTISLDLTGNKYDFIGRLIKDSRDNNIESNVSLKFGSRIKLGKNQVRLIYDSDKLFEYLKNHQTTGAYE